MISLKRHHFVFMVLILSGGMSCSAQFDVIADLDELIQQPGYTQGPVDDKPGELPASSQELVERGGDVIEQSRESMREHRLEQLEKIKTFLEQQDILPSEGKTGKEQILARELESALEDKQNYTKLNHFIDAYRATYAKLLALMVSDKELGVDTLEPQKSWKLTNGQIKALLASAARAIHKAIFKPEEGRVGRVNNSRLSKWLAKYLDQKKLLPAQVSSIKHPQKAKRGKRMLSLRTRALQKDIYGLDRVESLKDFHRDFRIVFDGYLGLLGEYKEYQREKYLEGAEDLLSAFSDVQTDIITGDNGSLFSVLGLEETLSVADILEKKGQDITEQELLGCAVRSLLFLVEQKRAVLSKDVESLKLARAQRKVIQPTAPVVEHREADVAEKDIDVQERTPAEAVVTKPPSLVLWRPGPTQPQVAVVVRAPDVAVSAPVAAPRPRVAQVVEVPPSVLPRVSSLVRPDVAAKEGGAQAVPMFGSIQDIMQDPETEKLFYKVAGHDPDRIEHYVRYKKFRASLEYEEIARLSKSETELKRWLDSVTTLVEKYFLTGTLSEEEKGLFEGAVANLRARHKEAKSTLKKAFRRKDTKKRISDGLGELIVIADLVKIALRRGSQAFPESAMPTATMSIVKRVVDFLFRLVMDTHPEVVLKFKRLMTDQKPNMVGLALSMWRDASFKRYATEAKSILEEIGDNQALQGMLDVILEVVQDNLDKLKLIFSKLTEQKVVLVAPEHVKEWQEQTASLLQDLKQREYAEQDPLLQGRLDEAERSVRSVTSFGTAIDLGYQMAMKELTGVLQESLQRSLERQKALEKQVADPKNEQVAQEQADKAKHTIFQVIAYLDDVLTKHPELIAHLREIVKTKGGETSGKLSITDKLMEFATRHRELLMEQSSTLLALLADIHSNPLLRNMADVVITIYLEKHKIIQKIVSELSGEKVIVQAPESVRKWRENTAKELRTFKDFVDEDVEPLIDRLNKVEDIPSYVRYNLQPFYKRALMKKWDRLYTFQQENKRLRAQLEAARKEARRVRRYAPYEPVTPRRRIRARERRERVRKPAAKEDVASRFKDLFSMF